MRFFPILLVWALAIPQDPPPSVDQLVEGLRSSKVEERNRAERLLLLRDDDVRPALEKAAADPDPEVSTRARGILEMVRLLAALSPALTKAIPGAREKIASRSPHAWTEIFLEATEQQGTHRRHPGLGREDLLPLGVLAARGAERTDVARVCGAIAAWELTPAGPELIRWLDEPDWEIRRFVIEAAVACRDPSLFPVLLDRCRRNQDGLWSLWAGVLARAGCREVVPEIVAAMLTPDQNRRWTGELVNTFADLDAVDAVPALLRMLRSNQGSREVLPVLALLAPDEILPALVQSLSSDEERVRQGALHLLTECYVTSAALPQYRNLLEVPATRQQALTGIGNLRRRDLLPEIRSHLEDPSVLVRRKAAALLASFGDKSGLPELIFSLKHPEARVGAMYSIRALEAREAIPDLLPLLKDPQVRQHAIDVLGALGCEGARAAILEGLGDPAPEVRRDAAVALTNLDGVKAVPKLLPMLDDPDANVQSTAAQMLSYLHAKEPLAKYRDWLRSPDANRRSSAVWFLASCSPADAVPGLIQAMDDDQSYVRSSAAGFLGSMNFAEAAPQLRVLLRDREVHVRQSAATALAWLGDRSGVLQILRHPSYPGNRFELNVLRRPDVCRAWRAKILTGLPVTGSSREVLEAACARAGIALEAPADLAWPPYSNFHALEGANLLVTVSNLLWETGGAVVEEGKLRVMTPREGRQFWMRWWAEEQLRSARLEDQQEGKALSAEIEAGDRRLAEWRKQRAATAPPTPEEARAVLTPFLRGVPGLEEKLTNGRDEDWTLVFLEAAQGYGHDQYQGVKTGDLEALAPRALRGALSPAEISGVLHSGAQRRLTTLRPQAEEHLKHQAPEVKVAAAHLILALDGPKALPRTLSLLDDPDGRVRQGFVEMLGGLGMVEAAPEVLARKDDPSVRSALLRAASGLRMEEALPLLLSAAKKVKGGNDDYMGRMMLGFQLIALGNPSINGEIRECLKTEDHPNAVENLLRLLGQWGCREAIPDILDLLKNPRPMSDLYQPTVFHTLSQLGAKEASPEILAHLKAGRTLHAAADAAAQLGLAEAVPPLRKLLAADDPHVLAAAAVPLAALGDRDSVPRFRELLSHAAPDVRASASLALAVLGDRESHDRILAIARAEQYPSTQVLDALAIFRSPEAIEWIAGKMTYPSTRYLRAMALGGEAAMAALRRKLGHSDVWTRYGVVRALGHIDTEAATAELLRMLQDEAEDVRWMAAQMLCRRGLAEGVPLTWDQARKRYSALPFELNAIRRPAAWAKLKSAMLPEPFYGTPKQLVERIAAAAGLPLEGLSPASREYPAWAGVYLRIPPEDLPINGLDALDRTAQTRWTVVLESDRVRVLPRQESLEFWKAWYAEERR